MSVDIIVDGGSAALTVQSYGRFTLTLTPSGRAAYTESGEMFWESFEGKYYFAIAWDAYPGDWETYGATLTDITFSMNGGFGSGAYDFDKNGTPESARISFEFIRV